MDLLVGVATALLSIVILGVTAIVNGNLIPRKIHESRIADRDVIIAYLTDANQRLIDSTSKFAKSGEVQDKLNNTLDEQLREQEGRHL